jgi:hypothetical protein
MKTSFQFCFHSSISPSLHSQPFWIIPFLSSLTRSYVSVQVHPSCVNFCKSSVSAEPQLVKMYKLEHQSYPSKLKDSDFSSVHPINYYLNLNKQQSLAFEDQF